MAVLADPDLSIVSGAGAGEPGDSLSYKITITNSGNTTDVINISTSSTAGFPNEVWVDVNQDGIPGNDGDYLLTDTDGDGNIDTGALAPGASITSVLVVVVVPGTSDGTDDATTITVTSSKDPTVSESVTLNTTANAPVVAVVKSVSPEGSQPPGQVLTYTTVVTNSGDGTATDVTFSDKIPTYTTYVPGSITVNGSNRTDAQDGDNGFMANQEVIVKIGNLGPGGSHTITFRVTIN